MQKRKAESKEELSGSSSSKQQCTTAQQLRNEAREKIIAERKERNRRSAAASRKRKDDEIIQLRQEVEQLKEANRNFMKIIMQLPGGVNNLCTNSIKQLNQLPVSQVIESANIEDDSNSNSDFSVISDVDISTSTQPLSDNFIFSPNSSEPAVFQ